MFPWQVEKLPFDLYVLQPDYRVVQNDDLNGDQFTIVRQTTGYGFTIEWLSEFLV